MIKKSKRHSQVQSILPMLSQNKGLSAVIATVLLILLALALVGIVWGIVDDLVKREMSKTSCLDTFGKVEFNHEYICYNVSSKELMFSVGIGDIEIEKVTISVSAGGDKKSFNIVSEGSNLSYIRPNVGSYGENFYLPEKNSGRTYFYDIGVQFLTGPDSLEIYPVINENTCSATDSATEIVSCFLLVS